VVGASATVTESPFLRTDTIIQLMRKVNDYQQAHPWKEKYRWIPATFYTGVMALYETTKDGSVLDQALHWAQGNDWEAGREKEPANRMTCGQTYLQLYFLKKDPAMIVKMKDYIDQQIESAVPGRQAWWYCDTLFVAPPTLAMMAKATGDRRYLDYLHKMYWDVTDQLFDRKYRLFYRDEHYFDATTPNGKKVFWARGNGWVIAGIPRVLRYLPTNDPDYKRYVGLYQALVASISKTQGSDGLWRSNLADPDQFPNPETSSTAFFCYALAAGINDGHLPRKKYMNVAIRAWQGLASMVQPDGKLGYVQTVAAEPGPATADMTHEYALGIFMLAGSEIIKLKENRPVHNADLPTNKSSIEMHPEGPNRSPAAGHSVDHVRYGLWP
jgi:rhamnogalacturonyl hydrolase YesR